MRSRVSLVWLLVVGVMAFGLAACGGAVDGGPTPYPVGFTTRSVTYTLPDSTQRTVAIDIWYPAREAQPTPTQSPSNTAPDSPPHNDATHPLVIFHTALVAHRPTTACS
jgi:hypothetical protein